METYTAAAASAGRKPSPALRPRSCPQKPRKGNLSSPLRLETCSKGLMSALLKKLESYRELQDETRFGYYRGGYFRLAKSQVVQKKEELPAVVEAPLPTSWLEGTFPSSLGSDHWLSPKIEIKAKFKFAGDAYCDAETQVIRSSPNDRSISRCCECGRWDERRSLLATRVRSNLAPYPLHAPKVFGFTGPLVATRPKTACARPSSTANHRRTRKKSAYRRVTPVRTNPEPVTVIDVKIPTPKFRPAGAGFPTEESEEKVHHKAISLEVAGDAGVERDSLLHRLMAAQRSAQCVGSK